MRRAKGWRGHPMEYDKDPPDLMQLHAKFIFTPERISLRDLCWARRLIDPRITVRFEMEADDGEAE